MLKKYMLFTVFVATLCITPHTWAQSGQVPVSGKIVGNRIVVTYNIPPNRHQSLQKDLFKFDVEPVAGMSFGEVVYPKTTFEEDGTPEYHGQTELYREFKISSTPSAKLLNVTASYQICENSGTCYMPEDVKLKIKLPEKLASVSATEPPPENISEKTDGQIDTSKKPTLEAPATNVEPNSNETKKTSSLIYMILLAFLGGLILNLMPCVLPVLSIKMLSIVNSASQNRREIMKGGMVYTAGILVSFAIMATVVVVIKKSGENVGWGFQFQNPFFVFGLLAVIWAFALSLLGVYHIQLPGATAAHKASSSHGLTGTFMSGVFAVLLATPCTAPMLGSAVGFTLKQSTPIIYLMMLVIGLGLAFPFILLGIFPAAIKLIPKPGNWMNVFSNLMGFLLIGTAVFLARTLSFIISQSQFINTLWFLLVLSFALWLYGIVSKPHIPRVRQWTGTAVALAIILLGGGYILDFSPEADAATATYNTKTGADKNWRTFSPQLLDKLRQEGSPVFIDFSAEWCMTCKANEAVVLNTQEIQKDFKEKGVALLKGDFTKKDPVILEWLGKYDRGGVPLYLLFVPGQDNAIVFPEIITKQMIKKALAEHLK